MLCSSNNICADGIKYALELEGVEDKSQQQLYTKLIIDYFTSYIKTANKEMERKMKQKSKMGRK